MIKTFLKMLTASSIITLQTAAFAVVNTTQFNDLLVDERFFSGIRSKPTSIGGTEEQVVTGGKWENFSISYEITKGTSGDPAAFHYHYGISGFPTENPLNSSPSYFFVEVSNNFTESDMKNVAFSSGTAEIEIAEQLFGPTESASITVTAEQVLVNGAKFEFDEDLKQVTVEFWSDKVPVWGNFYVKNGGGNKVKTNGSSPTFAYNFGFDLDPNLSEDSNYNGWIPTPDTINATAIPEPSTYLTLVSFILALYSSRLRRKKRGYALS